MTTELAAAMTGRMAHIFFDNRQHDVPLTALDVGDGSTPQEVKVALAVHLNIPVEKFRNYTVVHETNGNVTLRPEAVFGA